MNEITAIIPRLVIDFPYMMYKDADKLEFSHEYILENFLKDRILGSQCSDEKSPHDSRPFSFNMKVPDKVVDVDKEFKEMREKLFRINEERKKVEKSI